jgi:hypothetical protein
MMNLLQEAEFHLLVAADPFVGASDGMVDMEEIFC